MDKINLGVRVGSILDRGAHLVSMNDTINDRLKQNYGAGFTTKVESETLPPGLNEEVIRKISAIKK